MTEERFCVICGSKDEITKHHLTERTLKRAGKFKKKISGEVIDLCRPCHDLVEMEKVKMRWSLKLQKIKDESYKEGYQDALDKRIIL